MTFDDSSPRSEMLELDFTRKDEPDNVRLIRQNIYDEFGMVVYQAWFNAASIQLFDNKCTILHPNVYAQIYIMQKLYQPLLKRINTIELNISTVEVHNK